MRKTALILLALMLAMAPVVYSQGGDPAVHAGEWLIEQQSEDGSFGDEIGATSLSVIAQASIAQDNEAALAWLESNVSDELGLDEASFAVIAVIAGGGEIAQFADGALLTTYSEMLRSERGDHIDGICMGLIAREVLELAMPPTAITALLQFQGEDGGFGASLGAESDITTTSLCAQVLVVAEETEALDLALGYLRDTQLEDHGWSIDNTATESDALGTAFVLHALVAADQEFGDWDHPERTMFGFLDSESGAFLFGDGSDNFLNIISTAVAIPVFRGKSLIHFAPSAEEAVVTEGDTNGDEGPALDANWGLVASGFEMSELDSADDFFVTVIDPFTDEELYGIEIINWTSEYQYTGYIVEQFLTAETLLWMAERDPTVWDNISIGTLQTMSPDVLAQLPEEVQARATE